MSTVVACQNIRYTVRPGVFEAVLRRDLAQNPDLLFLQEAGPDRDHILNKVCAELGYSWDRATPRAEPVLWKDARYRHRATNAIRLAGPELVGHLPGRRDRLPANYSTHVALDDLNSPNPDGTVVDAINFHLTAEVQYGAGYRKDLAHRLRVMRHKREKRRLGRRGRALRRRGHEVDLGGDGNFDGMQLGGFVSCWDGRSGGTLGNRAVDIIFADRKPRDLRTLDTAHPHPGPNEIDHDGVVAAY